MLRMRWGTHAHTQSLAQHNPPPPPPPHTHIHMHAHCHLPLPVLGSHGRAQIGRCLFHALMMCPSLIYVGCTECVCCCVFLFCRTDRMLSTWLQRVAMSAPSNTWCPRWSPCSTAQVTPVTPCYTGQLSTAILKWWGLPSMSTSWTPMRIPRCVFRHAGVLQRAVGPVVGCVMEDDVWWLCMNMGGIETGLLSDGNGLV